MSEAKQWKIAPIKGRGEGDIIAQGLEGKTKTFSGNFLVHLLQNTVSQEPGTCEQTGLSWETTVEQFVELHENKYISLPFNHSDQEGILEYGFFQSEDAQEGDKGYLAVYLPWRLHDLYARGYITIENIKEMVGVLVSLGKDHSLQLQNMDTLIQELGGGSFIRKRGGAKGVRVSVENPDIRVVEIIR